MNGLFIIRINEAVFMGVWASRVMRMNGCFISCGGCLHELTQIYKD
jgi:hypothetical protein